ncbi:Uncharacterised protein [Neisseria meningitidis]|nr:Uncharacterised protein [Neisseria meningitidis]
MKGDEAADSTFRSKTMISIFDMWIKFQKGGEPQTVQIARNRFTWC